MYSFHFSLDSIWPRGQKLFLARDFDTTLGAVRAQSLLATLYGKEEEIAIFGIFI